MSQTINFDFLGDNPVLLHYAALAEKYCHDDADAALINLRKFSEELTDQVFEHLGVKPLAPETTQGARLAHLSDLNLLPLEVIEKFRFIRRAGNAAAHVSPLGTIHDALPALKAAWELSICFHRDLCERYFPAAEFKIPPKQPHLERLEQELVTARAEIEKQKKRAQRAETNLARMERWDFFAFSRRNREPMPRGLNA